MDFKSLITKISSMDDVIETVKAPELPKPVQLNEDAELRVLAGTSTVLAEAKTLSAQMTCPVTLIDPAPAVCRQAAVLAGWPQAHPVNKATSPFMRPTLHQFYTTASSTQPLQNFVEKITDIESAECTFFSVKIN